MTATVNNSKELAEAINNNTSIIVIEGKLGDAAIRITAIGPVAWTITLGALGVAIGGIAVTASTAGAGASAGAAAEAAATPTLLATLGSVGVVKAALGIALAGGGLGTISSMRKYKAIRENNNVVMYRR